MGRLQPDVVMLSRATPPACTTVTEMFTYEANGARCVADGLLNLVEFGRDATYSSALPATGQPEMFRIVSPPAEREETPTASSFSQISGMSSVCAVQLDGLSRREINPPFPNSGFSAGPFAWSRATSPIARSWSGSRTPPQFVSRIMTYDSLSAAVVEDTPRTVLR